MPTVKLIPTKLIFKSQKDDFSVLSCKLANPASNVPVHPIYHNLTLVGANISQFKIGHRVECVIEPQDDPDRPYTYKFVSFGAFTPKDGKYKLTAIQELQALRSLMTNRQAESCHATYPHFVSMVLNGEEVQIDYNNIKYVKSALLPRYIEKIKSINNRVAFMPEAAKWGITSDSDLNFLSAKYSDVDEFVDAIKSNPYSVLMDELGWGFVRADKAAIKFSDVFTTSHCRAEAACIYLLKQNENDGNTRIGASELFNKFVDLCPEAASHVYDIVTTSERLYYEPKRKYVSLRATYKDECYIANILKKKITNPHNYPMDWQKFTNVDNMALTNEQAQILEMACKQDVMMLTGSAGCVDADTEFFTGTGWKRIADYKDGDMVLQYNTDGTAELVKPIAYIKKPCDYLWHFETLRGLNQTVCDEHRIIYETRYGILKECNIEQLKQMHLPSTRNFQGRFLTTFNFGGSGIELNEWQIRLMCAVLADGHFNAGNKNSTRCTFHIKKQRKKDRLVYLFNKNNLDYKKHESTADGYTDYHVYVPRREKHFTKYWFNCSNEQLRIIVDEIIYWDGCIRYTKNNTQYLSYSSSHKSDADFVQYAASSIGIRASISTSNKIGEINKVNNVEYIRKTNMYTVHFSNRTKVGLCSDNRTKCVKTPITKTQTKDGYKYCFTVPSHMLVLRRKDCIFITGNCGKTASTKALINMLDYHNYSYTLLTPTGISSKKLREATGREANTIHMFLLTEQCAGDYVLIDECGMVSVHLLSTLLSRLSDNTKIIFIADPSQLASISCGNVVCDLLDSGIVPIVNLTKIFRYNTSGIITIATDVRNGLNDHLTDKFMDYKFVEIDNSPIKQIEQEYARLLSSGYTQDDILILSPFNKGQCGSLIINNYIQDKFNPNPVSDVGWSMSGIDVRFRIGDKVINKKNEYKMPLHESMDTAFVANGDMGRIVDIESDNKFPTMVVRYECGDCELDKARINKTMLSYCISIHSSQGCQAKAVIVVCDKSHGSLVTRNLLYTAMTRAQKELVVIGNIDAITYGLTRQEECERNTWLKEMMLDKQDDA